jgi:hypothetical protein
MGAVAISEAKGAETFRIVCCAQDDTKQGIKGST